MANIKWTTSLLFQVRVPPAALPAIRGFIARRGG